MCVLFFIKNSKIEVGIYTPLSSKTIPQQYRNVENTELIRKNFYSAICESVIHADTTNRVSSTASSCIDTSTLGMCGFSRHVVEVHRQSTTHISRPRYVDSMPVDGKGNLEDSPSLFLKSCGDAIAVGRMDSLLFDIACGSFLGQKSFRQLPTGREPPSL